MTQQFLHRSARLFEKARESGHVANPPPVPLDETRLAQEIARIIYKRPPRSTVSARPAAPHWLGEEDDRVIVENYVSAQLAAGASDASAAPPEPGVAPAGDPSEAEQDALASLRSSGMTIDWVKKARRQRLRARLRDVAGWTVSITVSVALVVAVSVAMFGWPQGGALFKQLRVKSIDVSAIEEPRSGAQRGGDYGR